MEYLIRGLLEHQSVGGELAQFQDRIPFRNGTIIFEKPTEKFHSFQTITLNIKRIQAKSAPKDHRSSPFPKTVPFQTLHINIALYYKRRPGEEVRRWRPSPTLKLETAPTPRRRPQNDQSEAGVFLAHTTTKSGCKTSSRLPPPLANMARAGAGGNEGAKRGRDSQNRINSENER